VYSGDHPLTFGSLWQLAPIISAGVAHGLLGGLLAGGFLGTLNGVAGAVEFGFGGRVLTTLSGLVLYCVAGAAAGAMMDRLRKAEDAVAEARARERIAQTLHDGVLQTLAVIQRRSDDEELVALAAKQDRDLRLWISGGNREQPAGLVDLHSSVAALVAELTGRDRIPIDLVVVESPPPTNPGFANALMDAIREAATNSAKHAHPDRITVFLDVEFPAGVATAGDLPNAGMPATVRCEVRDSGTGFDPNSVEHRFGITSSLRAPIEALGGSVNIRSTPGSGTVVEITLPLAGAGTSQVAK
jgi:signal transduction histidine kinase